MTRWATVPAVVVTVLVGLVAAPVHVGGAAASTPPSLTVAVVDHGSGLPLAGAHAEVYPYLGADPVATVVTGVAGRASVALPVGRYRVLVSHPIAPYLPAWSGSPTPGGTGWVTVWATGTTITTRLHPAGTVRGTATFGGVPLPGARVRLFTATSAAPVAEVGADASGRWSMRALPGSYRVEVGDVAGDLTALWFGGSLSLGAAAPVPVVKGATFVADVDLAARTTALVTGRVTLDGTPRAGAVLLWRSTAPTGAEHRLTSGADGRFWAELPAGAYVVSAWATDVAPVFFPGRPDEDGAVPLTLAPGGLLDAPVPLHSASGQPVGPLAPSWRPTSVTVVGDSIVQAATSELEAALKPHHATSVRGYAGATMQGARPIAEKLAALGPDRAVVALGTNDLIDRTRPLESLLADHADLLEVTAGASCVVVVTVRLPSAVGVPGDRLTAFNDHLRSLAASDARVQLVDWDVVVRLAALTGGPKLLGPDNIHPTPLGEDRLAELVAAALARCPAV